MSDRDPEHDYPTPRTGPGRRGDDQVHMWQRVITNPVSVITLCITAVVTLVTVVQRANNALPRDEFNEWRMRDSIVRYYSSEQSRDQYTSLVDQIADVKAAVASLRAHNDTLVHIVRRSVCSHDPSNAVCQ